MEEVKYYSRFDELASRIKCSSQMDIRWTGLDVGSSGGISAGGEHQLVIEEERARMVVREKKRR